MYPGPGEEAEVRGRHEGPVQVAPAQTGARATEETREGAANERGEGAEGEISAHYHQQLRSDSSSQNIMCYVCMYVSYRSGGGHVCTS